MSHKIPFTPKMRPTRGNPTPNSIESRAMDDNLTQPMKPRDSKLDEELNPSTTLRVFNPSDSKVVDEIKRRTDDLINFINDTVPANRHRSIALTNYEQAAMWAVKANFV